MISAITAIVGYVVGLVKSSSSSTTKNFSTLYGTLLEANKQLREQLENMQSRVEELEEQISLRERKSEREIRKLRQENLEQAQQLATFRTFWRDIHLQVDKQKDVKTLLFEKEKELQDILHTPKEFKTLQPADSLELETPSDLQAQTLPESPVSHDSGNSRASLTTVEAVETQRNKAHKISSGSWDSFNTDRPTKKIQK